MTWLRVKNWAEFQHYRDRRPPWIKLHRDLLDDFAWHRLPDASKALAPLLWLLASERADGAIPYDREAIAFRLHMTGDKVDAAIAPLIGAGFLIEEEQAAGKPLAARVHAARSESERESEKETERERDARARETAGTRGLESPAAAARAPGPWAPHAAGGSPAAPIAEDWTPSLADRAWAARARPDLTPALLEAETERFRNHAIGNRRLAHDWGHLWRNWVMKAALDPPPAAGPHSGTGSGSGSGTGSGPRATGHMPSIRMAGPDGLWKIRLSGYRPGQPWKYEGDPPGGPNCKVPPELIRHWRVFLRELEELG